MTRNLSGGLSLRPRALGAVAALVLLAAGSCSRSAAPQSTSSRQEGPRLSILLVTLDTTRADAIGPEAESVDTPAFDSLAARGTWFRQAYATAPETLPSHGSMMTGLYPAGHGVHENGRNLSADHPLLPERLQQHGYSTAAFVSSFVLARRFGLARGFDVYDDEMPAREPERSAALTTQRAIAWLRQTAGGPVFLWVHYFDPHTPYEPPDRFRSRYPDDPYLGEIAAMDEQLGVLVAAFDASAKGPTAIIAAGDHGEGLGDHGESQHGNLLYQSTMRVPLVVVGPSIRPGPTDAPVSVRRVFHTVLDFAGLGSDGSLRGPARDVVLGEAMKPFLEYGWQPQVMAVEGARKAIYAGRLEVYDLASDPDETRDLASTVGVSASLRKALEEYPVPSSHSVGRPEDLDEDARRQLASLGYVGSSARPVVRPDAPRPADMVHLFDIIERASALFVEERYKEVVPLLTKIVEVDPDNLDAMLRLATAYSFLGQDARAVEAFKRAEGVAPESTDVRMYLALHYARGRDWLRAVPMLEQIVAETPQRLPALEALAAIRERQGRIADAVALRQTIHVLRSPSAAELVQFGRLAMSVEGTSLAIESFERARQLQGSAFEHDLELGVLYLAARRFEDARAALDRVPPSHPAHPMALFKRAQVSVLLNEPDRAARIERARTVADATTRELIANERLFDARR